MLAETVSLDGGTLLIFLIIALLLALGSIAVVVLGFVLAPRAGRGSQVALGWWIAIVSVEALVCFASFVGVLSGNLSVFDLVPVGIVAAQVAVFVQARRDRR